MRVIRATKRRGDSLRPVFDAHTPYAVLERENQSLRDGLARLRAALSGAASGAPGDLRGLIELVREKLSARFAFEERMGHMRYVGALRPSLEPKMARLRVEHREMLSTLDHSVASLRSGLDASDVGSTVLSLLERFDRHELDERQLVRSALLRPEPPRG